MIKGFIAPEFSLRMEIEISHLIKLGKQSNICAFILYASKMLKKILPMRGYLDHWPKGPIILGCGYPAAIQLC